MNTKRKTITILALVCLMGIVSSVMATSTVHYFELSETSFLLFNTREGAIQHKTIEITNTYNTTGTYNFTSTSQNKTVSWDYDSVPLAINETMSVIFTFTNTVKANETEFTLRICNIESNTAQTITVYVGGNGAINWLEPLGVFIFVCVVVVDLLVVGVKKVKGSF